MDFTLSLTHFCEAHGPKSVLCTQVLPLECALCQPSPPSPTFSTSRPAFSNHSADTLHGLQPSRTTLKKTDTDLSTLSGDFSAGSTTVDSAPDSPSIERHPFFLKTETKSNNSETRFRYGRSQGDTCASCSFSVPQEIAMQLPQGAPGSISKDGKSKTAPVLRSREFVCLRRHLDRKRSPAPFEPSSSEDSKSSSSTMSSSHSDDDCHDHNLTYLTAKSPDDPESYALLRAAVIRALSCEHLPRGMSDGPLCFGDAVNGYTIAYIFRLTDIKARGRIRTYAFLALAGKDPYRAFRACPILWQFFAQMANHIEAMAQHHQEAQKVQDEAVSLRDITPVSSFVSPRASLADGMAARRAQKPVPRSLADIVGDENIFTVLHSYFVVVMRSLGDRFGGLPLANMSSVYQTVADDRGLSSKEMPTRVKAEMV